VYPIDFAYTKRGVLDGHTMFLYPAWILYEPHPLIPDHGNKFGIKTLDQWFNVMQVDSIPTNIKLRASGASEDAVFTITRPPHHGTVTPDKLDSSYVTYKPNAGYSGVDSFMFKVREGNGAESEWAAVYINPSSMSDPEDPAASEDSGRVEDFKNVIGFGHENQVNIPLVLDKEMTVKVDLYTRSGDFLRNLADRDYPAGNYLISWNGRDAAEQKVSSGIYLAKIKLGIKEVTKKIVVIR
jgi:hypothetical protein